MANTQKLPGIPIDGRKSASIARNRLALLRATQQAIAKYDINVTTDQIAESAGITVSTIYQHFENKEELIMAANILAFREWEQWAESIAGQTDDKLNQLVLPLRLMIRMKTTHPLTAQVGVSNLASLYEQVPVFMEAFSRNLESLNELKLFDPAEIELRASNVTNCAVAAFVRHVKDPNFSAQDADEAVRISLKMLNIDEIRAKELFAEKLPELSLVSPG